MAQSTFHFGFGMVCATLCTIKPVLQALHAAHRVRQSSAAVGETYVPTASNVIARWCLWSYAAGIVAVVPAIARRLIGSDPTHPLWNLFLFYPIIDRLPIPSIILGELVMGSILATQYAVILLAIHQSNQPTHQQGQSGQ